MSDQVILPTNIVSCGVSDDSEARPSESQPMYPEPLSPDQGIIELDLATVPHDQLPDIDQLAGELAGMDFRYQQPTQQSIRTGLRFTKEQLAKMSSGELMFLPPVRCTCGRVIDTDCWNALWADLKENYDYYESHPGSFKRALDQVGVPVALNQLAILRGTMSQLEANTTGEVMSQLVAVEQLVSQLATTNVVTERSRVVRAGLDRLMMIRVMMEQLDLPREQSDVVNDQLRSLERSIGRLDSPMGECCRLSYTTPIFIPEQRTLTGVKTMQETSAGPRVYELTKLGHTDDWL